MKNKVSFIIPVYNTEKYIDECIQSILQQTGCPWELIIVDDGSTDCTFQICQRYADADDRVRVIKQDNAGSAVARNQGLDIATGSWISFVDADDWIEKDFLQKLIPYMREEYDFVMYSYDEVKGDVAKRMVAIDKEFVLEEEAFQLLVKDVIDTEKRVPEVAASRSQFWTKIYKKEFLEQKNIRLRPELRMSQDVMFNLCVYDVAQKAVFIPESLYNYRILDDSTCHKFSNEQVPRILKIMTAIGEFVKQSDLGKEGELLYKKRILVSLVNACRLDFCHRNNPKTYKERRMHFYELRNMEPFKSALTNKVICKFSFKKQICMWFVKFKMFGLLCKFLK